MRKCNEENERIKRKYFHYLRRAKRKDEATVQKAADGIWRFEEATGFADFKSFRIEKAIKFQDRINEEARFDLGQVYGQLNRTRAAAAEFSQLLEVNPHGSRMGARPYAVGTRAAIVVVRSLGRTTRSRWLDRDFPHSFANLGPLAKVLAGQGGGRR